MTRILVADDEGPVREVVRDYLVAAGYEVVAVPDGTAARAALERRDVDLAVLDVMMPGMGGLELCRWARDHGDVPVILLTARAQESDRIVGLDLGADDYVVKPFSPRELVARVRVVLRRRERPAVPASDRVTAGPLGLDLETREATIRGAQVRLTTLEFDLMAFFARHPRKVFSREQLLESVWGVPAALADSGTSTVTVHVRRLREKLEVDPGAPQLLQTVHGVGYRLVP